MTHMAKIDVLAYKWDVDNTDSFNEDIIAYSPNSIIFNWNYNKIWVQYKPKNIELKKISVDLFMPANKRSLFIALINIGRAFSLLFSTCYKFRPRILIVENYLEGIMAGIIKKLGLAEKTIYMPADWYAGFQYKTAFSNLINNRIFPYTEYLACLLNDVVVDRWGGGITEKRNAFWRRKIPTTKEQYVPKPRIQASGIYAKRERKNICFIGEMRHDSGLDIAIKSLPDMLRSLDIGIKVIGPKRLSYEYFSSLAKEHNLEQCIEFLGFVERKDFDRVLSDCFCGINILTVSQTHSTSAMPSKLMYYYQYLLPVIASEGIPQFVKTDIISHKLGFIIRPTVSEFRDAILKTYVSQELLRSNIEKYIESFPRKGIIEILKNQRENL